MLRETQHERNFLNQFKFLSVSPEPVEGLRESFSATRYSMGHIGREFHKRIYVEREISLRQ